jgi:hypothetical protein
MWHSGRRVSAARSWANARQQFASVIAERDRLRLELQWTKQSLDECRQAMRELQAASLTLMKAEAELAALYRERAIARARAAERNLSKPLKQCLLAELRRRFPARALSSEIGELERMWHHSMIRAWREKNDLTIN